MEGVDFGFGDPKIHLAYLTKLRLLPQAIRRKIGNTITGCYPESVVDNLKRIESLKNKGLSYSQIRLQMERPAYSVNLNLTGLVYLVVGLVLGYLLAIKNTGPTVNLPLSQAIQLMNQGNSQFHNLNKLGTISIDLQ